MGGCPVSCGAISPQARGSRRRCPLALRMPLAHPQGYGACSLGRGMCPQGGFRPRLACHVLAPSTARSPAVGGGRVRHVAVALCSSMEPQRQQTLWAIALENYQAAVLMAQNGWHNVSVVCSYYAVFTAMWVALGDPPGGRWEHGGIVERFALGQ